MSDERALVIPLDEWLNPQGNPVLEYSSESCAVYRTCWTQAGQPADFLLQFTFEHAWAARGLASEYLPFKHEGGARSYILDIENSTWLDERSRERSRQYPQWRSWDKQEYRHLVVPGHDSYVEVIAATFHTRRLHKHEAGALARMIEAES